MRRLMMVALLASGLVLAGCGDSEDDLPPPPVPPELTNPPTPPPVPPELTAPPEVPGAASS